MKNWMQPQNLGYLVAFLQLGFIVQYVGENLCRCVQVADDERSLLFLAKHTESLHAEGRMQLFPYTILNSLLIKTTWSLLTRMPFCRP